MVQGLSRAGLRFPGGGVMVLVAFHGLYPVTLS